MSDIPGKWMDLARYDLDTARAMLAADRRLYVLFCCQQAIEKTLKGLIAKRTREMPPRIHNLMLLAERAALPLNDEQKAVFQELSVFYLQTRYAHEVAALSSRVTKSKARAVLTVTEEICQWLSSML